MRAQGITVAKIAEQLGRTPRGISKVIARAKQHAATVAEFDYKEEFRKKSIDAIIGGLDCVEDQYKRGNLGVKVMQGLGELQPDGSQAHINVLINSVPPEWRERYFVSNVQEVEDASPIQLQTEG